MDCTTLAEIFAGERADDLTEAESSAFETHLGGCGRCLESLATAEGELAPLVEWEPPEPSTEQWDTVTAAVQRELDQPHGRVITPWSRTPVYVAAAAAVLFIAGLVFTVGTGKFNPEGKGNGGTAMVNSSEGVPGSEDAPGVSPDPVAIASDGKPAQVLEATGHNGYTTAVEFAGDDLDPLTIVVIERPS